MPRSGWGRAGHRRSVLVGATLLAAMVGGSIAAWAEVSGGSTGYRMATVTRADIGTTLAVVGNVEPVDEAADAFQVAGKVATVSVTPGSPVTAGETLGTLDTTALSESVSSARSTLSADEAKLAEDEASQSGAAASASPATNGSPTPTARKPTSSTTTTTTTPAHPAGSAGGSTITKDQTTLTQAEQALSKDQQQEAADLAQAQNDCTSANTSTATGLSSCETALQTVSADEQQVSKDQAAVSKDETALAQALTSSSSASGSPGSGGAATAGSSPTAGAHVLTADTSPPTGSTGNGGSGNAPTGNSATPGAGTGTGSPGSSANTDTPAQIASDQAAIDTAQAKLTEAQQSLNAATLTSPIAGTVVSVGIKVGQTVSAGSATEVITIIGTKSYEVEATLDSSQVPSVKAGQSVSVAVDGTEGTLEGTVSQVGPVQPASSGSGYTYPVVVALPRSGGGLYPGSTADATISTGEVSHVVAVPTSAVTTVGSHHFVLQVSKGQLVDTRVKVGMIGDVYTQVLSGLAPGQHVVLADYAQPVPSSNTNTLGGLGSFLGGGGGFPGSGFVHIAPGGSKSFFQPGGNTGASPGNAPPGG